MILKASQRAGGKQLAVHLLRMDENDHVEVHELRGFVADDLNGAFHEAYAVSRGTKCRQFLFSLSLNPPETENVPVEAFEAAIDTIEERLGLTGQPRAIVFHEKEGRRHAHCVWSRIDAQTMRAVHLPHFKRKLHDLSRQLYLEHGWRMPAGLADSRNRDPLNFTRQEWQQARRAKVDPKAQKALLQECWSVSDSRAAFANALAAKGYYLAQGDRRGFVAVDYKGEVYSLSRWLSIKPKEIAARLGDPQDLPTVERTRADLASRMTAKLRAHIAAADAEFAERKMAMDAKRLQLVQRQRVVRQDLKAVQETRTILESRQRANRLRKGLLGLWDWVTGRSKKIREQNAQEAALAGKRDRAEKQALIEQQLAERRRLQHEIRQARRIHTVETGRLNREIGTYLTMGTSLPEPTMEPSPLRRTRRRQPSAPGPE
ncbi:relaxase/mobilization nuclease-like protein [Stella humosa]|uniref:Relaxase/mobilization nuclease-like protein n=1 Tax=Stella humosa TaxID=94 RepID=A0A3N1KJI9_9PROT|nr:relaxase/mobilization nuclease domain-containing protein [Stella humosa]ROP81001.1 relaxase/mobilization nuclease-like protein [Stella humosa]BBK29690.1 hypothetical protein STHU_03240 [Stella humosa]